MKISMKDVFKIRRMINEGYTVKEVSTVMKTSEATVRNYTKSERSRRTA